LKNHSKGNLAIFGREWDLEISTTLKLNQKHSGALLNVYLEVSIDPSFNSES